MNNVRQASREQANAADFLANYYDSVLVGTPNERDLVELRSYAGEEEKMVWVVHPTGRLMYANDWENSITREYMASLLG